MLYRSVRKDVWEGWGEREGGWKGLILTDNRAAWYESAANGSPVCRDDTLVGHDDELVEALRFFDAGFDEGHFLHLGEFGG
jgi:hypothetical protein